MFCILIFLYEYRFSSVFTTSFTYLSCSLQRVLACRRELVAYDRNQRDQNVGGSASAISMLPLSEPPPIGRCYGCASAATEHCLTLLRALAASAASRQTLCAQGLIAELLDNNLRRGTVQVSLFYFACSEI
jgi:E3 ubiquitin-protein ligase UBR4